MKKTSIVAIISGIVGIVLLLCYGLFNLNFGHYHFLDKPVCHPLKYSALEQLPDPEWGRVYEYQTDQSVDEVVKLFDRKLGASTVFEEQSLQAKGSGIWTRKKLDNGTYVYQCISQADLVGMSIEQGCMYVKETPKGALIQTLLLEGETSFIFCDDSITMPGIGLS